MDQNGNLPFRVDRFIGLGLGFARSRPNFFIVVFEVELGEHPVHAQRPAGAGAPNDELRLPRHNLMLSIE